MNWPKGTEYFFSDIHGEDVGFIHLLRSASGNIRKKISELYEYELTQDAQNQLANLVYDPKRVLSILQESDASRTIGLQSPFIVSSI